jgi:hypothetical protein
MQENQSAMALPTASAKTIDGESLQGKVLCGYQGWFRCPGDGTGLGWRHWSRSSSQITPDTLTVDMWPDLSEFDDKEKYPAPGFTYPDGSQAHLFSSANSLTVDRHFDWMRNYGIDGVWLQRFVVGLGNPPNPSPVLDNVQSAANRTGRVFALEYDMSGTPTSQVLDRMMNDWRWLVDKVGITNDPSYLYQDGKPVLAIWGFFSSRFDAALAHQIIDFFTLDKTYGVFLVGGCQWWWRTESNTEWARAFRRFNAISPWNVGNVTVRKGTRYASTGSWPGDLNEAKRVGMLFLPVIYPGFSWDNLQRRPPGTSNIPRLGGEFLWDQFETVAGLGHDMAKVAMFDEVDEGTAIFKVTNTPPQEAYFVDYEGLPTDTYLLLTGEGTDLIRG